MKIIGLTGGAACGKTTVATRLAEKGFPIVDADEIAHELLDKDPAIRDRVRSTFGTTDRKQLRQIIFNNEIHRSKLEQILHPPILAKVRERLEELKNRKPEPPAVIVIIPLLYETEGESRFDAILAVVCKEQTQIQRLVARDKITPELAKGMIRSQFSNEEKAKKATYAIWNDGDKTSLLKTVDEVAKKIIA